MEYIPCPVVGGDPECKYFKTKSGCKEDEHHLMWPSIDYTSRVEKIYRNLPDNKVAVCRRMHDIIHRLEEPPVKPEREEMLEQIIAAEVAGAIALSVTARKAVYGT